MGSAKIHFNFTGGVLRLSEIEYFVNWVHRRNPEARTWKDYRYDHKGSQTSKWMILRGTITDQHLLEWTENLGYLTLFRFTREALPVA